MLKDISGTTLPQVTFPTMVDGKWHQFTTNDFFKGKNVVVFALPGAFTPTCSSAHVPRYNELAPVFKENGVDAIICISVNDTFVMNAWKKDQKADAIQFVADGNGELSEKLGMLVDKTDLGFGKRSWRYSMFVKDGVIAKMFLEPEVEGDPFVVSDADTMLKFINPDALLPKEITIFTKPGCPHCARAKALLRSQHMHFEELSLGGATTMVSLRAITGKDTVPQIYIEGSHIGGADDLEAYLAN